MKKRSDKNSATSAVAGFVSTINDRIPLPAGVELRSEAELNNLAPIHPRPRAIRLARYGPNFVGENREDGSGHPRSSD